MRRAKCLCDGASLSGEAARPTWMRSEITCDAMVEPNSCLAVSQESITKLAHDAKTAVRRLDKTVQQAPNTKHFLASHWREWFLTCGELAVTLPQLSEGDELWEEPEHKDGGASVLHMGMTLYGRRQLRCQRAEGASGFRGVGGTGRGVGGVMGA